MIGMTIGVATVLTMIAMGSGAQTAIKDQVRAAGMNLIVITAGNYKPKTEEDFQVIENARWERSITKGRFQPALWLDDRKPRFLQAFHPEDDPFAPHDHPTAKQRLGDLEAGLGAAATLSPGDADALRKLPGVQYVSEGVHENVHVTTGENGSGKKWFSRLHGDDVSLPEMKRAWKFPKGRFYTKKELDNADQVVVLGSIVAEKLFGAEDPVNKLIYIWKQPFKVIGVISTDSWIVPPAVGDDQFDAIYVPFKTIHRLLNLSKLNDISVTAASTGDVSRLMKAITELIRKRHNIGESQADDFTVTSQARKALAKGGMQAQTARSVLANVDTLEKVTLEQLGKTLDRAGRTMSALLASIAAVSLVVGGIGIMNVMLLSVTERTKEIGLRRALGARSQDVLRQFLFEAMTLSMAGGILGVILGVAAAYFLSRWASWATTISWISILVSVGVAASVGIFFGYYPARQASGVAPIESLKYE
jgi:putative ABC transport system permease protein